MRFLLVEAAQSIVRSLPQWRSRYFHLMMRRRRKIAKVTMARRLAICLYWTSYNCLPQNFVVTQICDNRAWLIPRLFRTLTSEDEGYWCLCTNSASIRATCHKLIAIPGFRRC